MNLILCFILIQTVTISASNLKSSYLRSSAKRHFEHQDVMIKYPYYFGFYNGQELNMLIIFKNCVPSVNIIVTIGSLGTKGLYIVFNRTNPNECTFHCKGTLKHDWIRIVILVCIKHINFCSIKYILSEAMNLSTYNASAVSHAFEIDDTCLDPLRPCTMEVDSKNIYDNDYNAGFPLPRRSQNLNAMTWITSIIKKYMYPEKQLPIKTSCNRQLNQYVCILATNLTGVSHKWYHDYGNQTPVIGYIPPLEARTTKLIMILEKFDDNTEIYSTLTYKNGIELKADRRKIQLFANESSAHQNLTTLKYVVTEDTLFDCRLYLNVTKYIQIGFISTANTISAYNRKRIKRKFNMSDNGTMLCCILHVIFGDDEVSIVDRYIEKRTILVYDESLNFVPKPMAAATCKDSTLYIIIAISAIGVVILIIVILIYIKKCRRKKNKPEASLELDTYVCESGVLYADLSLVSGDAPRPEHKEESTYAEIIGVLKAVK